MHLIGGLTFLCMFISQRTIEQMMEVAIYYSDDQHDTHNSTRPKIKSNEITQIEDDAVASHMVGVIVIKPRGDLSESPLDIWQRADEKQCNFSTHSNNACCCNQLLEKASDVSSRNWGQEYPGGVTKKREDPSVKAEGDCATDSCAGWELLQSPNMRRGSYIVVAPTNDDTQRKLPMKNETPMTAVNDCRANNLCDEELSQSPSRYILTGDETHGRSTGVTESRDVPVVYCVDIKRRCQIRVVAPRRHVRRSVRSRSIRSYFVTLTYNHAGDITQLDTRFDHVPEGRYFVVASKPNFPTENESAFVHGYLAPADSADASGANYAIVNISYPLVGRTVATPSESRLVVDCLERPKCLRKGRASRSIGKVTSACKYSYARRRAPRRRGTSSGNDKLASSQLLGIKSVDEGAARCADIHVFVSRDVHSDRVKYSRVIMRLANELGVAADVHQLLTSVRQARCERQYMDAILGTLVDIGRANESRHVSVVYEATANIDDMFQTSDVSSDHFSAALTTLLRREIENAYFHKKHIFAYAGQTFLRQSNG